jgi:hypothetical protein
MEVSQRADGTGRRVRIDALAGPVKPVDVRRPFIGAVLEYRDA